MHHYVPSFWRITVQLLIMHLLVWKCIWWLQINWRGDPCGVYYLSHISRILLLYFCQHLHDSKYLLWIWLSYKSSFLVPKGRTLPRSLPFIMINYKRRYILVTISGDGRTWVNKKYSASTTWKTDLFYQEKEPLFIFMFIAVADIFCFPRSLLFKWL